MNNLLKQVLLPENIFLDIKSEDRFSLIEDVSELLKKNHAVEDQKKLIEDAITREKEMPTGISDGLAFPHARTSAVTRLVTAFIRPAVPVQFEGSDGKPADLIFFSAIPHQNIDEYLKLTAFLIRILNRENVTSRLRKATIPQEIIDTLDLSN